MTPDIEKTPSSKVWLRRRISDYWDAPSGKIIRSAKALEKLLQPDRQTALSEIGSWVAAHSRKLNDSALALAGFCMADDLYKTASGLTYWDASIAEYLAASAGTLCAALTARGLVLQYVVDNAFEVTPIAWHCHACGSNRSQSRRASGTSVPKASLWTCRALTAEMLTAQSQQGFSAALTSTSDRPVNSQPREFVPARPAGTISSTLSPTFPPGPSTSHSRSGAQLGSSAYSGTSHPCRTAHA
jgi:hypothetical protein